MTVCVVHLVRYVNGTEPFRRFVQSYVENRAGQVHDLLVVLKGFDRSSSFSEYERILDGLKYYVYSVNDTGFDILPYYRVMKRFNYEYFCFINSYSIILDEDWLAKLYSHVCREEIGLAGVTGSYESVYLTALKEIHASRSLPQSVVNWLRLRFYKNWFPPFPNYHIRTNGFMISRDSFQMVRVRRILRKIDAMRFESGKNSLTRQVARMGLRSVVVGKNGLAYETGEWWKSNTYAQGDQNNLLILDNRTAKYAEGDIKERHLISQVAWGGKANPDASST